MPLVRETVLSALEKDIDRRYISIVSLQADGRLELDSACLGILSPKPGEKFSIINDSSSIIIARNPILDHKEKVISNIVYGSGVGKKIKWRLRLSQETLRILLACKIGFRAFKYGNEVALEAEPYIPPASIQLHEASTIEELAPYVLRAGRSIIHIDCVTERQNIVPMEFNFRLLGEYWIRQYHQDPMDPNFTLLKCGADCKHCKSDFPIVKSIYWFPVVGYHFQQHYARPALLSFKMPALSSVCDEITQECANWAIESKANGTVEKYCEHGIVNYSGKKIYKISSDGTITISKHEEDSGLTVEEKGLMKIAFKELEAYIDRFDGVNN